MMLTIAVYIIKEEKCNGRLCHIHIKMLSVVLFAGVGRICGAPEFAGLQHFCATRGAEKPLDMI